MNKKPIGTPDAPPAIGPYSQALKVGSTLYLSGQLPLDPVSKTMPDGIAAQTEQSLKNIAAILGAAGSSMDEVVDVLVLLKNIDDFKEMNSVYQRFFAEPFPARAACQVAQLPMDALIEIKVMAVSGSSSS